MRGERCGWNGSRRDGSSRLPLARPGLCRAWPYEVPVSHDVPEPDDLLLFGFGSSVDLHRHHFVGSRLEGERHHEAANRVFKPLASLAVGLLNPAYSIAIQSLSLNW